MHPPRSVWRCRSRLTGETVALTEEGEVYAWGYGIVELQRTPTRLQCVPMVQVGHVSMCVCVCICLDMDFCCVELSLFGYVVLYACVFTGGDEVGTRACARAHPS